MWRSGQNKSWVFVCGEERCNLFFFYNFPQCSFKKKYFFFNIFFFQEKTDQPHQLDTNHITRLSLDGLATSESMPLLNGDDLLLKSLTSSRCSSSLSMDQLSTMTAITSFDVSEDVNSDLLLEADQNTNSSNKLCPISNLRPGYQSIYNKENFNL